MDQNTILSEVKKAIDLWMAKTYNESEFYSHILAIIRDNSDNGAQHKEQLERLLFKLSDLQHNQAMYWSGHKNLLPNCKRMEADLIKKVQYLTTQGGYSIVRFQLEKPLQKRIF